MSCKHYKEALIQAAAPASLLAADLRKHFDACARCRAALEREQLLFASIDAGLHRVTNAHVPPAFLPSFRARLSQQAARQCQRSPAWALVATAAALTLAFGVVMVRNAQHPAETRSSEEALLASSTLPQNAIVPQTKAPQSFDEGHAIKFRKPRILRPESYAAEPRAFVPAEQQAAISRLVDGLRTGEIAREVLRAKSADDPAQELRISPIEVSPMAITPLEQSSQEDPDDGGELENLKALSIH